MTPSRARSEETERDLFETNCASFAMQYPFAGGVAPFVLGGCLALVGVVIPPLWAFVAGYAFRLGGATADGRREPPAFDQYRRLVVDGGRAIGATLVFAGIVVAVGASVTAVADQAVALDWVSRGAAAVVGLAGLYLLPAVLATYAATGLASKAFAPEHALAFATTEQYALDAIVWTAAASAALLASLFVALTIVGALAVPFIAVGTGYVAAAYWGYRYRDAAEAGVVPPVERRPGHSS